MSEEVIQISPADPMPSPEEVEAFIQAVNELVSALSDAIGALAEAVISPIRVLAEIMLRRALGVRLSELWECRLWYRTAWFIADHIPLIFLTRIIPIRFLGQGLIAKGCDDDWADED